MSSGDEEREKDLDQLFEDVACSFEISALEIALATLSIRQELKSQEWNRNNDFGGIDFDNLKICCAYLQRYAPCHYSVARLGIQALFNANSDCVNSLLSRNELNVVSLGGGPGNDLISFCRVFAGLEHRLQALHLAVVDLKGGWEQVFRRVVDTVREGNYDTVSELFGNVAVTPRFVQADLAQSPSPDVIEKADVLLMTKFLSVVPSSKKREILKNIFSAMKSDAVFIFVDIDSAIVRQMAPSQNMKVEVYSTTKYELRYERMGCISKSTFEVCELRKDCASEKESSEEVSSEEESSDRPPEFLPDKSPVPE